MVPLLVAFADTNWNMRDVEAREALATFRAQSFDVAVSRLVSLCRTMYTMSRDAENVNGTRTKATTTLSRTTVTVGATILAEADVKL